MTNTDIDSQIAENTRLAEECAILAQKALEEWRDADDQARLIHLALDIDPSDEQLHKDFGEYLERGYIAQGAYERHTYMIKYHALQVAELMRKRTAEEKKLWET